MMVRRRGGEEVKEQERIGLEKRRRETGVCWLWWWCWYESRRRSSFFPLPCLHLGSLASDASGQLNVLRHDGHSLSVDGAQVGVFKQTDQVRLRCFLSA